MKTSFKFTHSLAFLWNVTFQWIPFGALRHKPHFGPALMLSRPEGGDSTQISVCLNMSKALVPVDVLLKTDWLFLFVEAIMWNSIFPTLFHRFGYAWYAEKQPYVIVNYLNRSTQMFITAIPLNWINIFSLTNNIGKVISVQTHFSKFGQLLTQKLMTESVWINLRTNGNWIPERKILLDIFLISDMQSDLKQEAHI